MELRKVAIKHAIPDKTHQFTSTKLLISPSQQYLVGIVPPTSSPDHEIHNILLEPLQQFSKYCLAPAYLSFPRVFNYQFVNPPIFITENYTIKIHYFIVNIFTVIHRWMLKGEGTLPSIRQVTANCEGNLPLSKLFHSNLEQKGKINEPHRQPTSSYDHILSFK